MRRTVDRERPVYVDGLLEAAGVVLDGRVARDAAAAGGEVEVDVIAIVAHRRRPGAVESEGRGGE